MSEPWPSREARETFVRFLELELRLQDRITDGGQDLQLLHELEGLLRENFPRTTAYIQESVESAGAAPTIDGIRAIAWAEARSVPGDRGRATVGGTWTQEDIRGDIEECLAEARERLPD